MLMMFANAKDSRRLVLSYNSNVNGPANGVGLILPEMVIAGTVSNGGLFPNIKIDSEAVEFTGQWAASCHEEVEMGRAASLTLPHDHQDDVLTRNTLQSILCLEDRIRQLLENGEYGDVENFCKGLQTGFEEAYRTAEIKLSDFINNNVGDCRINAMLLGLSIHNLKALGHSDIGKILYIYADVPDPDTPFDPLTATTKENFEDHAIVAVVPSQVITTYYPAVTQTHASHGKAAQEWRFQDSDQVNYTKVALFDSFWPTTDGVWGYLPINFLFNEISVGMPAFVLTSERLYMGSHVWCNPLPEGASQGTKYFQQKFCSPTYETSSWLDKTHTGNQASEFDGPPGSVMMKIETFPEMKYEGYYCDL